MNINFSFRGLDHSMGLKEYAEKRLTKLEKLITQNTQVEVFFVKDKNEKKTEIKLNHNGEDYFAIDASEEFDRSIDFCVDKISKQIKKAKEKKVDRRGR
ncbi:MAG TPA: ribosome-associated translation inhibitor RaiA [bacterium]|nr:ribosome-associated translation inhibitor RaiA [bacterium]